MESLRLLLLVLMSQIEVQGPSQEVPMEYHQQVSSLVSEVQSQKGRIEQLMTMVQDLQHSHHRPSPTVTHTSPESQQSSESKGAHLRCDIGTGMGCRGGRVFGRSLQSTKVSSSSISSKPFGGWSKPSSTRSQCAKDTNNDTGRWTPIGQYPSRPTTGSDTHDNGKLGKQEDQLGQEASPESLLPSVRGRSTISSLAPTSTEPECCNERFSGILPSSGESRSPGRQSCSSPKLKQQCPSLCQKVYSQVLTIDTVEEANWITLFQGNLS